MKKDTDVTAGAILILFLLAVLGAVYHTKLWYYMEYTSYHGGTSNVEHVAWADIHMSPEPHDCDWFKAPIGDKECHYKISDTAVPVSQTGDPLDGSLIPEHIEVYIQWEKVSE